MTATEHGLQERRIVKTREELRESNEKIIYWLAGRIWTTNKEKTIEERKRELRKLSLKEKLLYPDEALHYGLIDGIMKNFPEEVTPNVVTMTPEEILFQNLPSRHGNPSE